MAGEIAYSSYRRNKYDERNYYSIIGGGPSTGALGSYLLKTGDDATGSYTFDTDTLFIDADNHVIGMGIGSDAPGTLLDMEGALTIRGIAAPSVSTAGQGIIYFDSTANTFKMSENGGAYKDIYGGYWTANGNNIYNNNSGNVGLGVTEPSVKLDINSTDDNQLIIRRISGTAANVDHAIAFISDSGTDIIGRIGHLGTLTGVWSFDMFTDEAAPLTFWNSSAERMRIRADGNVGINETDPNFKLTVDGTGYFTGEVLLEDNVGSETFFSGFAGSGWRLEEDSSGVNTLSVDNLYVRKSMNVYELIINQIRATNGSLWVSDSAKVEGVGIDSDDYFIIDEDDGNIIVPFVYGDLLRCQKWTGRIVKYYTILVKGIEEISGSDTRVYYDLEDGTDPVEVGDVVVRIGNIEDSDRQGSIYITASDSNAPYIDVLDGIDSASFTDKTKVRLGNLAGITDADFGGALSGYGLYSDNVYLKGNIQIANPQENNIPIVYNFQNSYDGWIANQISGTLNAETVTLTATTNDPKLYRQDLTLVGVNTPIIQVRIRRLAGTGWQGYLYYQTAGHAYWGTDYYKAISNTVTSSWSVIQFDMTDLTAGDTDFIDSVVTGLRFDFGNATGDSFEIDWIKFSPVADWGGLSSVPGTLQTPTGSGLFLSSTHMGYYTSGAWKTYMDNSGNMVLGDYAGGGAGLSWDQSGAALSIRGVINATSGDIGGWTINSAYLAKDTGTATSSSGMAPTDYPFYAGSTYANRATAPFRVKPSGEAYINDLVVGTGNKSVNYIRMDTTGASFEIWSPAPANYSPLFKLIGRENSSNIYPYFEFRKDAGVDSDSDYDWILYADNSLISMKKGYENLFEVETTSSTMLMYIKGIANYTGGNPDVRNLCVDTVTGQVFYNFS
jgi:hypothetical protein